MEVVVAASRKVGHGPRPHMASGHSPLHSTPISTFYSHLYILLRSNSLSE